MQALNTSNGTNRQRNWTQPLSCNEYVLGHVDHMSNDFRQEGTALEIESLDLADVKVSPYDRR